MNKALCKISFVISLSALLCACSSSDITAYDNLQTAFKNGVGGDIDPLQLWKAAVKLKVKGTGSQLTQVSAYSSLTDDITLYDRQNVEGSNEAELTVPQGLGNSVYLICKNEKGLKNLTVKLTGAAEQEVVADMNFDEETTAASPKRTAHFTPKDDDSSSDTEPDRSSLYGKDIVPNVGYTDLNVKKIIQTRNIFQEGVKLSDAGDDTNYELISRGPFNVSFFYGFTGCHDSSILGYYYHKPGTYEDIKFVDLTEVMLYDYIDGKAKIQYQLDGGSQWYDANFDYRDGYYPPYTTITERLGDNVYNIDAIISKYNSHITGMRGLTYTIDVPEGYRIGFYLKRAAIPNNTQRERLLKFGLPEEALDEDFYETNFSAKLLNVDGRMRSFYYSKDGVTYMGLEDDGTTGDFDCNDVVFGVDKTIGHELPTIVPPDIDNLIEAERTLPWTLAYEDIARGADFDFNDAVIRVTPNFQTHQATVTLMAAGTEDKMHLHYDGPEGDTDLGEIHELLGRSSFINTVHSAVVVTPKDVATVAWPNGYTMYNDARRFYLTVQRGNCTDCEDVITFNEEPGQLPQAICVPDHWKWPMEGLSIYDVYTDFAQWARDFTRTSVWDWHTKPAEGKTVAN